MTRIPCWLLSYALGLATRPVWHYVESLFVPDLEGAYVSVSTEDEL